MSHRSTLTWAVIFGVIALMFVHLPPMVAKQDAVYHTYSALVEVDALTRQKFVEPVDSTRLIDGAIRGVMLTLDPYSGYIAPHELAAFEKRTRGDYCGLGIEIGAEDGRLTVIAPVEGSPAFRAGVRPGDVILAVNDQDVSGRSVFDVEDMLVGPAGTSVKLTLLHAGATEPVLLTVQRAHVTVPSVLGFSREPSADGYGPWQYVIGGPKPIGYIRVSAFRNNTARELDQTLFALLREGITELVLDLRFNPGGYLEQAVAVVDRFVDKGAIVSTVNRRRAVEEYRANSQGTVRNVNLMVLINGSSASAAEIVAGSLQAHGRAVVVGERSFGKGSVQHLIPLTEHNAAIKLTVAYYRLPDGRVIHRGSGLTDTPGWGVEPDVVVPLSDAEFDAVRNCRRALDVGAVAGVLPPLSSAAAAASGCAQSGRLLLDRQLTEAVNRLRSAAGAPNGA